MEQLDYLQRFLFEHHGVRGELVFLEDVFDTVMKQREYPSEVAMLVGKGMTAAALLSATIKYNGSLILQTQTSGPVTLMVVQCNQALGMRALAKWQDDANFSSGLLGNGQMVITISPESTVERYQGVVSITSDCLNESLETYFRQSEQLPTRLWLAANSRRAVGFLIQKMPEADLGEQKAGEEWNYWEHIQTLAETIKDEELLSLDATTILHRLFHEEDIRLFEEQPVSFQCRCDKQKMVQALTTMGEEEVRDILIANPVVIVTCDFCNNHYAFSPADVDEIFISS
ncbi:MAG: Hsp33 family molecular chaperone HslO [Gammaproteobacteria bacterium]|nr:Hsp33 family molecular chaperone HslO [Gammaproteobacteria bacterium]